MSVKIIWSCDEPGCTRTQEVSPSLEVDGNISDNDTWTPSGWGGIGNHLCPEHEGVRMDRLLAEMKPDEVWTA